MMFKPELAAAVMAGRKTVTRRLANDNPRSPWYEGRCALQPGKTVAICPGRGKPAIGRVHVVSVEQQTLGEVFGSFGSGHPAADLEAQMEGFRDGISFQLAWLKINGGWDPDAVVWRIELARGPQIVVDGKVVGYGNTGMFAALRKMLA